MDRTEQAVSFKKSGYNCCQAVLLAFAEELAVSEETLVQLGAAFGGGMGCMEATCGALCGAGMVLGMKEQQKTVSAKARKLHKAFEEKAGATICKEIKGVLTGTVLCPCDDCVRYAAGLAEQEIADRREGSHTGEGGFSKSSRTADGKGNEHET